MVKESTVGTEVRVGLKKLWQIMSSPEELAAISVKAVPHQIKDMQVIEGDGGVGSILLYIPCSMSGLSDASYKEKISEISEIGHEIGFEYVEGGFLNKGFSYFKIGAKLSEKGENKTKVILKISYESENDEETTLTLINKAQTAALNFFNAVGNFVSSDA